MNDRRYVYHAIRSCGTHVAARFEARLFERFHVVVEQLAPGDPVIRDFDGRSTLRVDPSQPAETTAFSLAYQLARLEFGDIIAATAESGVSSEAGQQLLAAGLANYAAGALLMPHSQFRNAALATRHDIDRLRQRFGTSFEQTCHRLSTLQRPGELGIPMFFCRV